MKILLLGANGQLGRNFMEEGSLAKRGELCAASRDGCCYDGSRIARADLASPDTVSDLLDQLQPDVIVNTAAYTAVDRAQQEEALAMRINATAVGLLGQWAQAHGACVLHYSSDYIFNGTANTPYAVDATTAPLGVYGHSKLVGEMALRESGAHHILLRTSWVYAPHGHNFLLTMLRMGSARDALRVVTDQYGAPTSTALIVAGTLAALDTWLAAAPNQRRALEGTHHLVASGYTNWHGFAGAIFKGAVKRGLLPRAPRLEAIHSADYPTGAQRPAWSVLDNTGFTVRFGYALPNWQLALDGVLDALALGRDRI